MTVYTGLAVQSHLASTDTRRGNDANRGTLTFLKFAECVMESGMGNMELVEKRMDGMVMVES